MRKRIFAAIAAVIMLIVSVPLPASAAFSGDDRVVIVIDPGHGGNDPGASEGGVNEKTLTLKYAKLLRDRLVANGSFVVYLTHEGDTYMNLAQRGIYANNANADVLLSVHFDSADGNPSKNGVTSYTSVIDEAALITLGDNIASAVASSVGMNSNGVMRKKDEQAYYWDDERQWDVQNVDTGKLSDGYGIPTWCAKFGFRGMIVEHGFMSNASDFKKMNTAGNLEKMADAEANAIITYYTGHTHSYGAKRTDYPSNCVFQGKESEHCTVCDHRRNISLLPADPDNHFWINEVETPASCGVAGSITHECRITQNLIAKGIDIAPHTEFIVIPAPQDHEFELIETVDPGHTENGYNRYECIHCAYTFDAVLPAEGHTFKFISKSEPTCTEQGGNLYRCTVCSYEYRDGPAALGHTFTRLATAEPTCTEDGLRELECSVCGAKEKETIKKLGHDIKVASETTATCSTPGERISVCSRCGAEIREETAMIPHDHLLTAFKPATCVDRGIVEYKCRYCGDVMSQTLQARRHSWQELKRTAPDFFTSGCGIYRCMNCGDLKKTSEPSIFLSTPKYFFAALAVFALVVSVLLAMVLIPMSIVRRHRAKKAARAMAAAAAAEEAGAELAAEAETMLSPEAEQEQEQTEEKEKEPV